MDAFLGQMSGYLEMEMPNFTQLCFLTQAVTSTTPILRQPLHYGLMALLYRLQSYPYFHRTDSKKPDFRNNGHLDLERSALLG